MNNASEFMFNEKLLDSGVEDGFQRELPQCRRTELSLWLPPDPRQWTRGGKEGCSSTGG